MTCAEARELIGADPENASPELLAHLKSCPECAAYREQMRALNARIRRALEFDWQKVQRASPTGSPPTSPARADAPPTPTRADSPPARAEGPATPTRAEVTSAPRRTATSNVTPFRRRERAPVSKHKRPGLLAFAASLAAALVVGLTLWLSRPAESLAAEVVSHVEGEPNSWSGTQPVTSEELDGVLRKSGVKLGGRMQPVVYASACWFRGHYVPHFVVATKEGPVTVMILVNETVPAAQQFNENGLSGLLMPAEKGSVAVLSRKPMELDKPAHEVVRALQSAT